MRISILILFTLASVICFGQNTISIDQTKAFKVNLRSIPQEEKRYFEIQNLEAPVPGGDSERGHLLKLKADLSNKYPRKSKPALDITKAAAADPIIQNGYEGNVPGSSVPCDNTLAVSNSGIVMTARNSSYTIYDTNADTVMVFGSLRDFLPGGVSGTLNDFDPKVIYDPMEDRFILQFLLGTTPTASYITTCFMDSNDPGGDWNVYFLSGNPLATGHWSDYPAMALSEEELFITINLLNPGGSWQTSFEQTIVWQIDKMTGYNGDPTLTTQIWDNITEGGINLRNMHPVRGGIYPKGPNQFFLSNRNFASQSDSIYLVEITNTMASGSATMNVTLLNSGNDYFLSPSARQTITDSLQTNDSRVLGAIWENDEIHFVQNCMDTTTGNSAIYHGIITDITSGSYVCTGNYITDGIKDFGYPNIAHIGETTGDSEYLISFEYVSPVDSAGTACMYYDGIDYSILNIIKQGEGTLDRLTGTQERWGDYSGIHKKYNQPCSVWSCGTFARNDDGYGVWITEIRTQAGACNSSVDIEEPADKMTSLKLYPNPSTDFVELTFDMDMAGDAVIRVFDMNGKLVEELFNGPVKRGKNLLSFSIYHLTTGQYTLSIVANDSEVIGKSFIKN
jgi:hypothetical protein